MHPDTNKHTPIFSSGGTLYVMLCVCLCVCVFVCQQFHGRGGIQRREVSRFLAIAKALEHSGKVH